MRDEININDAICELGLDNALNFIVAKGLVEEFESWTKQVSCKQLGLVAVDKEVD